MTQSSGALMLSMTSTLLYDLLCKVDLELNGALHHMNDIVFRNKDIIDYRDIYYLLDKNEEMGVLFLGVHEHFSLRSIILKKIEEIFLKHKKKSYLSVIRHSWLSDSKHDYEYSDFDYYDWANSGLRSVFSSDEMERSLVSCLLVEILNFKSCPVKNKKKKSFFANSIASLVESIGGLGSSVQYLNSYTISILLDILNSDMYFSNTRARVKWIFLQDIFPAHQISKFLECPLDEKIFENLIRLSENELSSVGGFDKGYIYQNTAFHFNDCFDKDNNLIFSKIKNLER